VSLKYAIKELRGARFVEDESEFPHGARKRKDENGYPVYSQQGKSTHDRIFFWRPVEAINSMVFS
jgi:hypothetical protein